MGGYDGGWEGSGAWLEAGESVWGVHGGERRTDSMDGGGRGILGGSFGSEWGWEW